MQIKQSQVSDLSLMIALFAIAFYAVLLGGADAVLP
jgi:hypothetical protein